MNNFEDLEVWQDSCRLAVDIYKTFEQCRDRGLKDQVTRAAVSIASNIAEGAERRTAKEFATFLYIAKGSAAELRTQLYISAKVNIIHADQCKDLTDRCKTISKRLQSLISAINKS